MSIFNKAQFIVKHTIAGKEVNHRFSTFEGAYYAIEWLAPYEIAWSIIRLSDGVEIARSK